jgi:hypothetical protein
MQTFSLPSDIQGWGCISLRIWLSFLHPVPCALTFEHRERIHRRMDGQAARQTDRQTDGRKDGQTGRQADKTD